MALECGTHATFRPFWSNPLPS